MNNITYGVDLTNILLTAFMHADPKRAKTTDSLTVFFSLLGFARKMLVKSTPIFQTIYFLISSSVS